MSLKVNCSIQQGMLEKAWKQTLLITFARQCITVLVSFQENSTLEWWVKRDHKRIQSPISIISSSSAVSSLLAWKLSMTILQSELHSVAHSRAFNKPRAYTIHTSSRGWNHKFLVLVNRPNSSLMHRPIPILLCFAGEKNINITLYKAFWLFNPWIHNSSSRFVSHVTFLFLNLLAEEHGKSWGPRLWQCSSCI